MTLRAYVLNKCCYTTDTNHGSAKAPSRTGVTIVGEKVAGTSRHLTFALGLCRLDWNS